MLNDFKRNFHRCKHQLQLQRIHRKKKEQSHKLLRILLDFLFVFIRNSQRVRLTCGFTLNRWSLFHYHLMFLKFLRANGIDMQPSASCFMSHCCCYYSVHWSRFPFSKTFFGVNLCTSPFLCLNFAIFWPTEHMLIDNIVGSFDHL